MSRFLFELLGVLLVGQPNASWQAEIQRRIANEEYRITFQREHHRYHAANRKNNLRAYFDSRGLALQRRVTTGESWKLGMRLAAVGRRGNLKPVSGCKPVLGRCIPDAPPGATRGCMRRLEYYHLDVLVIEWFENSRAGIEQGFEVWLRPPGEGRLRLVQAITGAGVKQASRGVKLIPDGGRPLDFKGVSARDAHGKKLEVRLLAEDGKLVTLIDDSRADYPIRVE